MSLDIFPGLRRDNQSINQFTEKELSWFQLGPQENSKQTEEDGTCPGCGTCVEKTDIDEVVCCRTCGEVIERTLDLSAEYRFFGSDDRSSIDPCRVGAPIDMRFPASTLGTMILHHSSGGPASAGRAMARIRRYHTWNMIPYKERSLLQVFEQYALTATNFGINTRAIDTAKQLYIPVSYTHLTLPTKS